VAPRVSEYVPAPQSVHVAVPVSILYFPATQAVHGPPLGPVCPRAQRQAETAVCPVADVTEFAGHAEQVEPAVAPRVTEYVPAPQSVHVALPMTVLYFPAAHAEHVPPFGPEYPVLQTQLCTPVLAAGEFVCTGHA
jgi:hypothetical protein